MSPYQQDVIDATLAEYDKQAQAGITNIGLGAAQSGNLGGGREGVMRAQYQNQSDMNRAALTSTIITTRFWSSTKLISI
jgi:O-acetyl-ADP-ribose deacetylase (regulator of RNase III)